MFNVNSASLFTCWVRNKVVVWVVSSLVGANCLVLCCLLSCVVAKNVNLRGCLQKRAYH